MLGGEGRQTEIKRPKKFKSNKKRGKKEKKGGGRGGYGWVFLVRKNEPQITYLKGGNMGVT